MQCRFWNAKGMSKVSDGLPLKEGNELDSFTNIIMVPLSGTTTIAFFGTCSKLPNVRILKILDGTLPHVPNCFFTHMKLDRNSR
jgi:hypothetical protein